MTSKANIVRPKVKCPHCGLEQELEMRQLSWPTGWKPGDDPAGVVYKCEGCEGIISEDDRPQIPLFYTRPFAELVGAFLDGKESPAKLRPFIEEWLGDEWIEC